VPYLFVNVVNLSPNREVEITHVWFDAKPEVHVRLPKTIRLRSDEPWETWVEAAKVAHVSNPERQARVRLSSGKVIKSRRNRDVPPEGVVPGTDVASGVTPDMVDPPGLP
jgi:hypothetical protein